MLNIRNQRDRNIQPDPILKKQSWKQMIQLTLDDSARLDSQSWWVICLLSEGIHFRKPNSSKLQKLIKLISNSLVLFELS